MLSVVILTKNEEKNIIDCLETVSWADEIVIIDDNSSDRTIEIIKNLENKKIKIFINTLNADFAKQRNFGLSKTTKNWVLFIDADERISKNLREEINTIIINKNKDSIDGYYIKRKDSIWGKTLEHGESSNIKLLRLAKRDAGAWIGKVHEVWLVSGKTDELENFILHYPHQNINEFLKEINFYSTIRARELFENDTKISFFDMILYPKAKFLFNYLLRFGFLDGIEGLIFALMMSFHSFLVRSKLWLLWQQNQHL